MKRKTITLDHYEIPTQAELQMAVASVARDMLVERETKNAMDAQLQNVRDKYARELTELSEAIEARTELIEEYCAAHPDLFPKDRRSVELPHAVIGYRTGQPAAKPKKGWTWAAVLEAVKARKWLEFLRETVELNKDALVTARDDAGRLDKIGVQIVQAERFYVEPKDLSDQPLAATTEVCPPSAGRAK
jgi:phage host-nuclease inhibitor protein Gam